VFAVASATEAESDKKTNTDGNHVFKSQAGLCGGYAHKFVAAGSQRRLLPGSSRNRASSAA
jgi:hypothetical protein